jgi:hypothetical protein
VGEGPRDAFFVLVGPFGVDRAAGVGVDLHHFGQVAGEDETLEELVLLIAFTTRVIPYIEGKAELFSDNQVSHSYHFEHEDIRLHLCCPVVVEMSRLVFSQNRHNFRLILIDLRL